MVHVLREFTITLPDSPGSLADVASAMGSAGLNLSGFLGYARGAGSEVHFVASDAASVESFLKRQSWKWRSRDVVAVPAADEPGFVGRVASRLGDAGVNIEATYLALQDGTPLVVFSVDDVTTAKKALA
ncbi:MAG TPA: hypothetical protein VM681_01155 [Candidatus Thermoplasmatota archaeon]|nr:hypothetical protein [Candidatus Thermoplasmatota archaeon]